MMFVSLLADPPEMSKGEAYLDDVAKGLPMGRQLQLQGDSKLLGHFKKILRLYPRLLLTELLLNL